MSRLMIVGDTLIGVMCGRAVVGLEVAASHRVRTIAN